MITKVVSCGQYQRDPCAKNYRYGTGLFPLVIDFFVLMKIH